MAPNHLMKIHIAFLLALTSLAITPLTAKAATSNDNSAGDPGWPREHYRDGNKLIVYQHK